MYINFWYPVCLSDELDVEVALRAKILGLKFVVFRDAEGKSRVLADTCVHRGGSLSKGRVVNGRIACPYHGWQFEGTGICKHIPVLEDSEKVPARAKVDSYPVIECYGIVFAFLGDLPEEERPPLFQIPEWKTEGWRSSGLIIFEVDAYYERSIENGLDPVHNEFVHTLQGNIQFRQGDMKLFKEDWITGINVNMAPPKKAQRNWRICATTMTRIILVRHLFITGLIP